MQTIKLMLDKAREGSYLRVQVQVAEGCRELKIRYVYTRRVNLEAPGGQKREEIAVIDLALEAPDGRLVGASGSEKLEVTINEAWATPGYRSMQVLPGTWQVVLGIYKVPQAGCPLTLTVDQVGAGEVLLCGDTHVHTCHSDGLYTPEALKQRAKEDGLDFLCVCDHNTQTALDFMPSDASLTIIPGMELTWYRGHMNLLGVRNPIKTYVANSEGEERAILQEARASGALLSVNHPFYPGCEWRPGLNMDMDLLEVWNGPFVSYNRAAVDAWQGLLASGRVLPILGGSDAHRAELFRLPGAPAQFVYSQSRMPSDILRALHLGRSFIGMDREAPQIDLAYGDVRMGGTAVLQAGRALLATVRDVRDSDELVFWTREGVLQTEKPGRHSLLALEIRVPENARFVRLEILRELPGLGKTMASLSNPIYFR